MTRFNSDNSFVASIMRSRRHDNGRPASRKEVTAALIEMQRDEPQNYTTRLDESSQPTAKNVLDKTR